MRRLLLVVTLVGCTHATSSGPAWPKQHAGGGDGGESLAPREGAKSVEVAIESSDSDADKPAPVSEDKPADKPAAATEAGAPAAAAAAAPEDAITTEEIVIEVGPDD